MGGNALRLGR